MEPRDTAIFCFVKYVLFDAIVKKQSNFSESKVRRCLELIEGVHTVDLVDPEQLDHTLRAAVPCLNNKTTYNQSKSTLS